MCIVWGSIANTDNSKHEEISLARQLYSPSTTKECAGGDWSKEDIATTTKHIVELNLITNLRKYTRRLF